MSLLDLFKRKAPPLPSIQHPTLGSLVWSPDDDGWKGTHKTHSFLLGHEGAPTPSEALCAYALSILEPPEWLDGQLTHIKAHPSPPYLLPYLNEIQKLTYGEVGIYLHKGGPRVFASLEGGLDYRAWRIEFAGHTLEGLGFDS